MFNIEAELKKLPHKPGVYIMHDKDNQIIYVGKAISLKNRVIQYFRKNKKTKRIQNMVSLIDYFEYIVVDNEQEALILECNLIKKNRPKFNVLLKDDKTYPYIKINIQDEYPNIYITRKILHDGAKYFGPYSSAGSAKEMVDFIKEKFKIRQCKSFKYKDRPCLNYHIKKCLAPCMGYVSKEEYRKQIDEIIQLLEGKIEKVVKKLKTEMQEASNNMEFEKAAYLRDKIIAMERIAEKQKVSNINENDIDVIGFARNEFEVCVEIFYVRRSKMIGREHFFLQNMQDETEAEIILEFVKQYYVGREILPNKIMMREEIEDKEIIEKWLSEIAKRKVEIKTPQKGEKLRLVEMAEKNAYITLENKNKEKYNVLAELKEVLNLDKLPRKIETFDISNLSGTNMVAGMCVMQDGVIKKNLSRNFKIKTVYSQDDPACMKEVVTRRLKHSIDEEEKGSFGLLPDCIFADGGITQIRAIKEAINDVINEIEKQAAEKELTDIERFVEKLQTIAVFGMVKNDKHQTRALIDQNRNEIKISQELMNVITLFQDTVHAIAIGYHKKLRNKEITHSELDDIKGIGPAKKKLLLTTFGSVEKIKKANIEELTKVKGITRELAEKICSH